jgi:hypothetical protein
MGVTNDETVASARAFLVASLRVLQQQRVVPPPVFHPYIAVGRDYFGPDLTSLPEFSAFEGAIQRTHARFREDVPLMDRDFASPYIFSFLEACVARCCLREEPISPASSGVEDSLNDLAMALGADRWEVACCRMVSHLTSVDGDPLDVAGLRVIPLNGSSSGHSGEAHEVIDSVIPGARSAYSREAPFSFAPPEAVVVARVANATPFEAALDLSDRIERFLLLVRLLHAGTCQSAYEVQGETCFVRRFRPTLVHFRGDRRLLSSTQMIAGPFD